MKIDWVVVLFEVINFAVLVAILIRFVFRPVARVLEQRRAEIVERDAQTRARELQADTTRTQLERELARIDAIADERIAEALAHAQTQAEQIVGEARTLARTTMTKTELEIDQTRHRALEQFRREVMVLGIDAARRVVAELGAPEVGLAFVRRALRALADTLPDPSALPSSLRIHISAELDPHEVRELALRELPGVGIEVEIDSGLIAGARVIADGHEVAASAGASLDTWYQRVLGDAGALAS